MIPTRHPTSLSLFAHVLACTLLIPASLLAQASNYRVVAHGVADYTGNGTCTATDIPQADDDAQNFLNQIDTISFFTELRGRYNNNLRDDYLKDSALTGDGIDDGSVWGFDNPDAALSYFSGHGSCGPGAAQGANGGYVDFCDLESNPQTWCDAQTNPSSGEWNPVACRGSSSGSAGWKGACRHRYAHAPITCATGDTPDQNSSFYSGTGKEMELTNVRAAFLSLSCGAHIDSLYEDIGPMMDGVWLVGTVFIQSGDTAMVEDRGDMFGYLVQLDYFEPIAKTWLDTMWMMGSTGASGCPTTGNADGGINGCGGHVVVAADDDASGAEYAMYNRRFYDAAYSTVSPVTNPTHFLGTYSCNWDCIANPPVFN